MESESYFSTKNDKRSLKCGKWNYIFSLEKDKGVDENEGGIRTNGHE